jgi:hypothetical protein
MARSRNGKVGSGGSRYSPEIAIFYTDDPGAVAAPDGLESGIDVEPLNGDPMELFEMVSLLTEHSRLEHSFDYSATMRTMTQDCYQERTSIGLRYEGQLACFKYYEGLFGACPNIGAEQRGLACATNYLVTWSTLRGTMTNEWLGLAATEKSIELPLVLIVEFRNGLLVGETLRYDAMELCQPLDLDYSSLIAAARRVTESVS